MADQPVVVKDMTCLVCAAAADTEALDPEYSHALQVLAPPGARIVHQRFLDGLTRRIRELYEQRGRLERRIRELEERETRNGEVRG